VIIGNGMASYKLCERLTASGGYARYRIIVFGDEPSPAYDRVHLTDFLGGRSSEELTLASREWYAENEIELHTGERVVSVDRDKRTIETDAGKVVMYDKLVFATGSQPYVPPIEGSILSNVFVYRTVGDLAAIRRQARPSQSAAVIGGGLLGLEAARALQTLGMECHVIEYAPQLLPLQLDPRGGKLARQRIEDLGIRIRVNARAVCITSNGGRRVLHFAGQSEPPLEVDLIVIAAGVKPRDELARACGLEIGGRGGVAVNSLLQTSDPNIFAIGECASYKDATYGLVAPAYRMAEVLADRLSGCAREFSGADLSTRLKVFGVEVAVLGDYNQPACSVSWQSDSVYRRIVIKGGRLIGASALGEWPEIQQMQDAVLKNRRLWPWQVKRFQRQGRIWRHRTQSVKNWPAEAIVCNCMNVSCGALKQACDVGAVTVEALARATGASTLCGSCKPLLGDLLTATERRSPRPQKAARSLVAAAFAALLLTILFFVAPPIPYSGTVQSAVPYDLIWRNGVWKEATGFTLLTFSLAGLVMSLRKRWMRFRFGAFEVWRLLHALMGVGALIVLVAHTGLRFGTNLNFALMSIFVGANLLGAFAGVAGGLDLRWRRFATWMHIVMIWPLPVLVGFHILMAYYF
jgi:nitrite reductase (NADH) large subunit